MKKIFLGSLLIISMLAGAVPAQQAPAGQAAQAAKAKPSYEVPFVNKKLSNGLEVIVLPDPSVPLVTVELAVRNGSFTEPPELNGLSHLYEHMFFKTNYAKLLAECLPFVMRGGSNPVCNEPMRLREQIGDVSYIRNSSGLGITYNGTTREEVVNYYFTTTSPYVETAVRMINDAVRYPMFDEEEFEAEKRVVLGELDRHESNPYTYLFDTVNDKLYYKYPTRKKPGGTKETVAAATIAQMRLIQSRYYHPNNSAMVITGDVKPDEIFKLVERVMGSWQPRAVDPFKEFPLVEHPPLTKSEAVIVEKKSGGESPAEEQNVFIQIGWHGPSIGKDDEATYAADVFSFILTQPDHRFQRNIVDAGLAALLSINYYTQRNVGPISILMVTTPEKARDALKAVYSEVAQFGSPAYFTDEELENAKNLLEADDLFSREKPSEYAHTLGFWWSTTGIEYFRGYHRNLRAVSRADISRYISTYITGKNHVAVALVSPDVKAKAALTEKDLLGGK